MVDFVSGGVARASMPRQSALRRHGHSFERPPIERMKVSPACAVPSIFLNRGFKMGCLPEPSGASA